MQVNEEVSHLTLIRTERERETGTHAVISGVIFLFIILYSVHDVLILGSDTDFFLRSVLVREGWWRRGRTPLGDRCDFILFIFFPPIVG